MLNPSTPGRRQKQQKTGRCAVRSMLLRPPWGYNMSLSAVCEWATHLVGNLLQIVLLNQLKGGTFVQPELLVQDLKQHVGRSEEKKRGKRDEWHSRGRKDTHLTWHPTLRESRRVDWKEVLPCSLRSSCLPGEDPVPWRGRTASRSKAVEWKKNLNWTDSKQADVSRHVVNTNLWREENMIRVCHAPKSFTSRYNKTAASHIAVHEGGTL